MSINVCSISGNLTKDVELRSTHGGTAVATFTVAVNDRKKDPQSGEWVDVPNYIPCVMFGKRAESIGNFVSKGSKVSVLGKLRWSQWQDKQTQKNRSKIEVIVDEIEFMSRKDNHQGQYNGSYGQQYQQQPNYSQQQQYAPQNGSQQTTGGYQQQYQQGYQQPQYQQDVASSDIPF